MGAGAVGDRAGSPRPDGVCVLCPAVAHRPGAFKAELSKLVIVAKAARSEL